MPTQSVLIAGCGDVGSRLGQSLSHAGLKVYGLRRNINQLPDGIHGLQADLGNPTSLSDLPTCDIVVYAVTASDHTEAGYQAAYCDGLRNLLKALPNPPKHLFFTSSTSVYHQSDDSWVDENSPTEPTGFSGKIMLQAEHIVRHCGFPATVVRFSGIYGPGRNHLLNQVRRGCAAPESPTLYSNRIHRDDCADVLKYLIERSLAGHPLLPIYLASDDEPTPIHEVSSWLAAQLDVEITDHSARRRAGSKRCSNRLLRATGFNFRYPSYREGYSAVLAE